MPETNPGDGPVANPLLLEVQQVVCPVHGEPFRTGWPGGYPTFAVLAAQWLLQDDAMQEECGGEVANLPALLTARPLCCRMGPAKLLELYEKVNARPDPLWDNGLCRHCDRVAAGVVLDVKNHWGRVTGRGTLCLACLAGMAGCAWGKR